MMHLFMTLNDGTEIVHSDMMTDGTVKVYIEKPDEKYCFRHATCWLPQYKWEDIYQFTDEDINRFQEIMKSTALYFVNYYNQQEVQPCRILIS